MNKITLKASANGVLNLGTLEHPNRMPFKGVLTYLNRLSTEPPHGANGLRVFIPTEVGAPAVASLKGMAINYIQGNPIGHDPTSKIGVITDAKLGETQPDGAVPIEIEGYIYALDFKDAATSIKASQADLGFSYETAQTQLVKGEIDGIPCAIATSLGYFTGASVLLKASASYADTSLAASADNIKEENTLDFEKMLAELKEAFAAEVGKLREEFGAKKVDEPKVEEPKADETKVDEPKVEEPKVEEPKVEEPKVEEPKDAEPAAVVEQPKAEEATLNASAMQAEIDALKAELETLKQDASLQASARKSVAYPTSALAKFNVPEEEDKSRLMASIEARTDLTVPERLEMKLEALAKLNK